jgi:hypothetical protein
MGTARDASLQQDDDVDGYIFEKPMSGILLSFLSYGLALSVDMRRGHWPIPVV